MDDEIKLPSDPSDRIHGFYKTSEGRRFLRTAYGVYRDKIRFGDKKVAIIIADENFLDQENEINLTRSALKRWYEQGQSELWSKDISKTLRVMRRLEEQMMHEPEIAEVCNDRSAKLRTVDTAMALSNFFYAPMQKEDRSNLIGDMSDFEGVFEILWLHPNGQKYTQAPLKHFWVIKRHDVHPFLLIQEVEISANLQTEKSPFYHRYGGFIYTTPRKSMVSFLISHKNPVERKICTFESMLLSDARENYFVDGGHQLDDIPLDSKTIRMFSTFDGPQWLGPREHFLTNIVIRRDKTDRGKFIMRHFSGTMWDVPL
jgi:hypothetical protein